jgi:2-amino-4-hydroxy-6-hydroxymethyldihydropteridine diphosphokinase
MSTTVVIALGSNLGARLANLRAAVEELPLRGVTVERVSSVWDTEAVPADQPPFLNAVLVGETDLDPVSLLAVLKQTEHDLLRRPGRRWGPRPIDLDILFYGEESIAMPELTVPHERVAERAFVLAPLAEVVMGPLPVIGRTAEELLRETRTEGVTRTDLRLFD